MKSKIAIWTLIVALLILAIAFVFLRFTNNNLWDKETNFSRNIWSKCDPNKFDHFIYLEKWTWSISKEVENNMLLRLKGKYWLLSSSNGRLSFDSWSVSYYINLLQNDPEFSSFEFFTDFCYTLN